MVRIRTAQLADMDQLPALFDNYRIFYGKESDIDGATRFLSDRISRSESVIFVAETGEDKLAGFVQLYPVFSSTRMKRLWLLNDLFVDKNFRGQGISVELIERAKGLCKETNACGLILETAKTNAVGNSLYRKTDFILDKAHNYYSWDAN